MWDVWSRHDAPIRSTRCAVPLQPRRRAARDPLFLGARGVAAQSSDRRRTATHSKLPKRSSPAASGSRAGSALTPARPAGESIAACHPAFKSFSVKNAASLSFIFTRDVLQNCSAIIALPSLRRGRLPVAGLFLDRIGGAEVAARGSSHDGSRNQTPAFCFPQGALTDDTAGHRRSHTTRTQQLCSWSPQ